MSIAKRMLFTAGSALAAVVLAASAATGAAPSKDGESSTERNDAVPMVVTPAPVNPWDSRLCGTADFELFHYTTTSPHYDTFEFVDHFDDFPDGHIHNWRDADHGTIYNVRCTADW